MQTKALSRFIGQIKYEDLPVEVVDRAKMCVEDLIGVTLAGIRRPEATVWSQFFGQSGEDAVAWMPGFPRHRAADAAALNAAVGHLMDMDDLHNASIAHLGVVTIPTAIAIGQKLHRSGQALLSAVVAGYEVGGRIGAAINPSSYWYWHTTGLVGSFCAAVAAGRLMELDEIQMLHCFGSAGTQSAGLWQFLKDGAMSKSLHTANATLCGIRAAELSALGFTGATEILEGERGLIRAVAPNDKLDALTKDFAAPYRIMTNSFKPYACCRHTHSAIHAVERLMAEQCLIPEEVMSVEDRTYHTAVQLTDNNTPSTPYACKFSLQYCIALALLQRELTEESFAPEQTCDPLLRSLMGKIRITPDDELEREFQQNPDQWSHLLRVTLVSGEVREMRVDFPPGDYQNPFDWETADAKFLSLTEGLLEAKQQRILLDRLHHLEQLKDCNELFEF